MEGHGWFCGQRASFTDKDLSSLFSLLFALKNMFFIIFSLNFLNLIYVSQLLYRFSEKHSVIRLHKKN